MVFQSLRHFSLKLKVQHKNNHIWQIGTLALSRLAPQYLQMYHPAEVQEKNTLLLLSQDFILTIKLETLVLLRNVHIQSTTDCVLKSHWSHLNVLVVRSSLCATVTSFVSSDFFRDSELLVISKFFCFFSLYSSRRLRFLVHCIGSKTSSSCSEGLVDPGPSWSLRH